METEKNVWDNLPSTSNKGPQTATYSAKNTTWITELPIIRQIRIIVPAKLTKIATAIAERTTTEYMLLTNVETTERRDDVLEIKISAEYYVPEQEATTSTVEAKDPNTAKYNVCIHKHPHGVMQFSSTDYDVIIKNYDVNLLYVEGHGWAEAVARLKLDGDGYIIVPAEICEETEPIDVPEDVLNRIKKKEYRYYVRPPYGRYYSSYYATKYAKNIAETYENEERAEDEWYEWDTTEDLPDWMRYAGIDIIEEYDYDEDDADGRG